MAYTVQSYYINVADGDCAIHLLLDQNNAIHKSILIDGGRVGHSNQVQATIDHIQQTLNNNQNLQFNAIVVTHWDDDHFQGTQKLIRDDIIATYDIELAQGRSPDFIESKYMINRQNQIPPLETTFYCAETGFNPNVVPDDRHGAVYYRFRQQLVPPEDQLWIKIREALPMTPEVVVRIPCKVVKGTACIGYDFFSNLKVVSQNNVILAVNEMTNLDVFLSNAPTNGAPGFFCVGADGYVAGGRGQNAVTKNASSLMCLVIWPRQQPTDRWKISLYTGGDAEKPQELNLLEWLALPNNDFAHIESLGCIKAGHHGSLNGTHYRFFMLQPKTFIMSAGEQHGHPSFPCLFFILAWLEIADKVPFDRIRATCYPYWMTKAIEGAANGYERLLDTKELNVGAVFKQNSAINQDLLVLIRTLKLDEERIRSGAKDIIQGLSETFKAMSDYHMLAKRYADLHQRDQAKKAIELAVIHQALAQSMALTFMLERWHYRGAPKDTQQVDYILVVMEANGNVTSSYSPPLPNYVVSQIVPKIDWATKLDDVNERYKHLTKPGRTRSQLLPADGMGTMSQVRLLLKTDHV